MKNSVLIGYLLISTSFYPPRLSRNDIIQTDPVPGNVFIIITDGFRWQEVFNGADSLLITNEKFTPDTSTLKLMYWGETREERRKKLLPFFWNVIAAKGQLLGNRELNNKVNVANIYSLSYPGYSEIFTGTTDITISGNRKKYNLNINVLEYLNSLPEFQGKIAIFSSWDVFPFILNRQRNDMMINSGYEKMIEEKRSETIKMINDIQQISTARNNDTRYDVLTFSMAKEYIKNNVPRIAVIGFGETDDYAHQNRYDLYLQQANQVDKMIAELWNMVQTMPAYKNNTSFLITTDHGRGSSAKHWSGHGFFIAGSSQSWLAMIGANIQPLGERGENGQLYAKQFASMIANLAGKSFRGEKTINK